jgi:amino acid transporter
LKEKIFLFFKNNPALLVTAFTAYGYYCAYFYEVGYCNYFHIPSIYINVEIINIIYFTASTSGIILLIAFHLRGVVFDRPNITRTRKRAFFELNFVAIVIWYFFTLTFEVPKKFFWIYLSALIILNLALRSYFWYLRKKAARLTVRYTGEFPNDSPESINEKVAIKLNPKNADNSIKRQLTFMEELINYAIGVFIMPAVFLVFGFGAAQKQTYFSFLSQHPTMMVIKKYGDEIICKNYDKKSKKIGDSTLIFKLDNSTKLSFVEKEISNKP